MAWDFLRRLLKLVGGKVMSKLAPRLIIFQYYDRLGLEVEEQKKRFRILYYKTDAEVRMIRLMARQTPTKMGISSILEESRENN
jgi:hypothetical protein